MDDDLLSLGEDLVTTAARVVRWLPRDADFGLSLAAVRLLARISDHGPVRISDLAVAENCSQPTITNHVKKLEAEQLVTRTTDPRDARASMIALTDAGRLRLAEMRHSLGHQRPAHGLLALPQGPEGPARGRRGDAPADGPGVDHRLTLRRAQGASPGLRAVTARGRRCCPARLPRC